MAIVDVPFAPSYQTRQGFHQLGAIVHLQVPFVNAHLDRVADQAGGNGIGVAQHANQAAPADFDFLLPADRQRCCRQRLHHLHLFLQPFLSATIAFPHHLLQEYLVGFDRLKVTASPQEKVLFECALQTAVGGLDVTVFVWTAQVRRAWLHAIMVHELQVPDRVASTTLCIFLLLCAQDARRC